MAVYLVEAAAHRLRPNAFLHTHLAALQDSAAAPNVAVLDEQPEEQAAQQPPSNWTLHGNSVVLPGDHSEQGSYDWLPPPPPRPAQPASATAAKHGFENVEPVGSPPPLKTQCL